MAKVKPNILFILDKSGSMSRFKDVTISGFNEQIQEVLKAENASDAKVSLVQFNGTVDPVFFHSKVNKLVPLTAETYVPDGSTALLDAMMYGVTRLLYETRSQTNKSYLVIILTDGEENSSKFTSSDQIRRIVTELQAQGNWTFAFMGANVDLNKVCSQTGIKLNNAITYDSNSLKGNQIRNQVMTRSISAYMSESAAGAAASTDYFGTGK